MKPNSHRQLSFYKYAVPAYRRGIQVTHAPSCMIYMTNYSHKFLVKAHTRSKLKRCVDMHDIPLKFAVNRSYDDDDMYEDDNDITVDNTIQNIIKLSISKHERTKRSYIITIIQMIIRMILRL